MPSAPCSMTPSRRPSRGLPHGDLRLQTDGIAIAVGETEPEKQPAGRLQTGRGDELPPQYPERLGTDQEDALVWSRMTPSSGRKSTRSGSLSSDWVGIELQAGASARAPGAVSLTQ